MEVRILRKGEIEDENAIKILTKFSMDLRKFEKENFDNLLIIPKKEEFEKYFRRKIKEESFIFFIAFEKEKPIGMIYGYKLSNKWYNDLFYLDSIYVAKNYRGKGIGKELLKRFIEEVKKRNGKAITLEVYSENKNAIKLYSKLGFEEKEKELYLFFE